MIRNDLNYMMYDIDISPYNLYFIADMHFCHKRIDELVPRERDWINKLIYNWNNTVYPNDVVIIVGDACLDIQKYKCCQRYIQSLNGVKILIRGNHDRFEKGKLLDNGYFMVVPHLLLRVKTNKGSYNIFIHHEPLEKKDFEKIKMSYNRHIHIHIHGHTHLNTPFVYKKYGIPFFNVSCEVLDYTPVHVGTIIYIAKQMEEQTFELKTINDIL